MGIRKATRRLWVVEYRVRPHHKWRTYGGGCHSKRLAKRVLSVYRGLHGDSKLDRPESRIVKYVPEVKEG